MVFNLVGISCLMMNFSLSAQTLKGKITLTGKNADKANIEETVIYFKPDKSTDTMPLIQPHKVEMIGKKYTPRVSAITVDSEIQIPNHDSILHNAFSLSKPNDFDLGLYKNSEGKRHTFSEPGLVRIFCNVHYHMVAYVLVLDTPYYTQANSDGSFSLDNLPTGKGKLIIWHERSRKKIKTIDLPVEGELNLNLKVTKRRIPKHKNKSGKSYKKKRRRGRY